MIKGNFIYDNKLIKYKYYFKEKTLIYGSDCYSYNGIIKYKTKSMIFNRTISLNIEKNKSINYDIYNDKNLKVMIENRIIKNLKFNEEIKNVPIIKFSLKHKGLNTIIKIERGHKENYENE